MLRPREWTKVSRAVCAWNCLCDPEKPEKPANVLRRRPKPCAEQILQEGREPRAHFSSLLNKKVIRNERWRREGSQESISHHF